MNKHRAWYCEDGSSFVVRLTEPDGLSRAEDEILGSWDDEATAILHCDLVNDCTDDDGDLL